LTLGSFLRNLVLLFGCWLRSIYILRNKYCRDYKRDGCKGHSGVQCGVEPGKAPAAFDLIQLSGQNRLEVCGRGYSRPEGQHCPQCLSLAGKLFAARAVIYVRDRFDRQQIRPMRFIDQPLDSVTAIH
jgi:hypothetical protein